jgi:AbrB family looped-hinge helix DNA binding protein
MMVIVSQLREVTMPSLRVGRRGQITIPSDVRKELRLDEGARLIAMVRDGELVLRPAGRSIFELRGSVPVEGPQDFDAIRAEVARRRAEGTVDDGNR